VLRDPEHVGLLRSVLDGAARDRLVGLVPARLPGRDELAGRWVRWFDLGRVAPYEGSNVAASAGGITPRLADVAGFYRAFGMTVPGDRPDHVVAELEFLALALLHEADATDQADGERRDVIADVIRSFLRDHIGTWIDAWAARVGSVDELAPWAPYAAVAVDLVRGEARRRNVIPARSNAVLPAQDAVAADEEPLLACGDGSG
jgi:nitrate reductase assembly molybdenum cofactor insertion protein NarJ